MRTRTKLIIVGLCILFSGETDARQIRLHDVKAMQGGVSPWTYAVDADLVLCEDALSDCETGCEARVQSVNDYWRLKHDIAIEGIVRRDNEITRLKQRIKELESLANKAPRASKERSR